MKLPRLASRRSAALAVVLAVATAGGARISAARTQTRSPDLAASESNITRVTSGLLEQSQLEHRPLDRELSERLIQRYMDALDQGRSLFLQSDANEFAPRAGTLPRAIEEGDTSLAREIFARYLQRLGPAIRLRR